MTSRKNRPFAPTKGIEWSDHSKLEVIIVPPMAGDVYFYTFEGWDGNFDCAISLALDAYEESRSLKHNPGEFDHIELTPLK